jgi:hypothetical protein
MPTQFNEFPAAADALKEGHRTKGAASSFIVSAVPHKECRREPEPFYAATRQ